MSETRGVALAVGATLDATNFQQGAEQVSQGAKKIGDALNKASDAHTVVDRKIVETSSGLQRLIRQIDPAAASTEKYERAQGTLNRALEAGRIPLERHTQLMALAEQRFTAHSAAVTGAVAGHNRL